MTDEGPIPLDTVRAMLARVDPSCRLREATYVDAGHHAVYRVAVETPAGARDWVLKAHPDGSAACGREARVLAILDAHTDLPVPRVVGVVDEDDDLPAPFVVMAALPGTGYPEAKFLSLPDATLAGVARSTGHHLATLHELDAVDDFGYVDVDRAEVLHGGRPSDDPAQLTVRDPHESWRGYLESEVERVCDALAETRFADLRAPVRTALDREVAAIAGPFDPAIARIDHQPANLALDLDAGIVTGLLDWEFCVAATPAYDLAMVEASLARGYPSLLPHVPDRIGPVRAALLEAYGERAPRGVEQYRRNGSCYALLAHVHSMLNFEDGFERSVDDTDAHRESAAQTLRERVRPLC